MHLIVSAPQLQTSAFSLPFHFAKEESGKRGCTPQIHLHWFCFQEEDEKEEKANSVSGRILEVLEGCGKCRAPGQGKLQMLTQSSRNGLGWDGGHRRGRFLINCLVSLSFKRSDSYPCGVNRNFCNGFLGSRLEASARL